MKESDETVMDEAGGFSGEQPAETVTYSRLTSAEVKNISSQLNRKINVPFIDEVVEEAILIRIVEKIDQYLHENIPHDIYDLIRSCDRGIDDTEARELIKNLSRSANKHIDIPYIPESVEYLVIRMVVGIFINSARKQWDIDRANEAALSLNIPHREDATDQELEAIVA